MKLAKVITSTSHDEDTWVIQRIDVQMIDFYEARHNPKRQRVPDKPTYRARDAIPKQASTQQI